MKNNSEPHGVSSTRSWPLFFLFFYGYYFIRGRNTKLQNNIHLCNKKINLKKEGPSGKTLDARDLLFISYGILKPIMFFVQFRSQIG